MFEERNIQIYCSLE